MQILLFEWLSGGGLWRDSISPNPRCPLQQQGNQMVNAVANDLVAGGVDVRLPIDARSHCEIESKPGISKRIVGPNDDLKSVLLEAADQVDHVLLIAPETNACLLECAQWLKPFEQKLISPTDEFIRLASSKNQTIEFLQRNGVGRVPHGCPIRPQDAPVVAKFPRPAVIKPDDGAGSEGIRLLGPNDTWNPAADPDSDLLEPSYRIESWVPGIPVSVSMLCGGGKVELLSPTEQLFESPLGNYSGAGYPIASEIAKRATELASDVAKLLPRDLRGYIGVDMVISDRAPRFDCVLEINPRLTTSYLRLREIEPGNLAIRMLAQAGGRLEIED